MSDVGLVQKTVAVLTSVAAYPSGIGLSDLARACGLPKATCFRILSVLEAEGWLVSDSRTRRFSVAVKPVLMFTQFTTRESVSGFVRTMLQSLSATTRETAGLDQLLGENVMVMAEVQGPYLISHGPRQVPRLLPSWRTSTGKVLVAFGGEHPSQAAVEADLQAHPLPTMGHYDDFLAELAVIRSRGYGTAYNELEVGLAAVAAPVMVGGRPDYALWVSGPAYRLAPEDLPAVAEHVLAAASDLSRLLSAAVEAEPDGDHSIPVLGRIALELPA